MAENRALEAGTAPEAIASVKEPDFLLKALQRSKLKDLVEDMFEACTMTDVNALMLAGEEADAVASMTQLFTSDEVSAAVKACKAECVRAGVNFGDGFCAQDDDGAAEEEEEPAPAPAAAGPAESQALETDPAASDVTPAEAPAVTSTSFSVDLGSLSPTDDTHPDTPFKAAATAAAAASTIASTAEAEADAASTGPPAGSGPVAASKAAASAKAAGSTAAPARSHSQKHDATSLSLAQLAKSAQAAVSGDAAIKHFSGHQRLAKTPESTPVDDALSVEGAPSAPASSARSASLRHGHTAPLPPTAPTPRQARLASASTNTGPQAAAAPATTTPVSSGAAASARKNRLPTVPGLSTPSDGGAAAAAAASTPASGSLTARKPRVQSASTSTPSTMASPRTPLPSYAKPTHASQVRTTWDGDDSSPLDTLGPIPSTSLSSALKPSTSARRGSARPMSASLAVPMSNGATPGGPDSEQRREARKPVFDNISSSLLRPTAAFLAACAGKSKDGRSAEKSTQQALNVAGGSSFRGSRQLTTEELRMLEAQKSTFKARPSPSMARTNSGSETARAHSGTHLSGPRNSSNTGAGGDGSLTARDHASASKQQPLKKVTDAAVGKDHGGKLVSRIPSSTDANGGRAGPNGVAHADATTLTSLSSKELATPLPHSGSGRTQHTRIPSFSGSAGTGTPLVNGQVA